MGASREDQTKGHGVKVYDRFVEYLGALGGDSDISLAGQYPYLPRDAGGPNYRQVRDLDPVTPTAWAPLPVENDQQAFQRAE